ncbi:MAG: catalase [Mucilaginibacter sp.]|uniref:catalase n=1 Tax=Mucilaginibacter sp. TaxID=1882438 RepID=UPI0031A9AD14
MKIKFTILLAASSLWGVTLNAQSGTQNATPVQMVEALHDAFGEHHARAVHTKGIILEGTFTPAASASTITKAAHFQKEQSNIVVRFSDFAGVPNIPDNSGLANPRGMAIKFKMKNGLTTDFVGHSFNGFPTPNSLGIY